MNNLVSMTLFGALHRFGAFFCQGYLAKLIEIEAPAVDSQIGNTSHNRSSSGMLGDDGHWDRAGCVRPTGCLSVATT